jgi:hypothetical protein
MGQSKINRERLRLEEDDLPKINSLTRDLLQNILNVFSLEVKEGENWPLRYFLNRTHFQYEFIFSQMGSLTVRLAQSERYRRNPPPIFYLSIGKYAKGEYIWEDIQANEVSVQIDSLKTEILNSIENYEKIMNP